MASACLPFAAARLSSWWQVKGRLDLPQWQGRVVLTWHGGQGPGWQVSEHGWLQPRGLLQGLVQVSQGRAAPAAVLLLLAPGCSGVWHGRLQAWLVQASGLPQWWEQVKGAAVLQGSALISCPPKQPTCSRHMGSGCAAPLMT